MQSSIPISSWMRTIRTYCRYTRNTRIWWTTCSAASWRRCRYHRSSSKWPVWRVGSRVRARIPFISTRCFSSRYVRSHDLTQSCLQDVIFQIWAANDLKIFIRMMTQRNVELQLQALDLIEKNQLAPGGVEEGDDRSADASSDPGWVMMSYAIVGTLPTKLYTGFGN